MRYLQYCMRLKSRNYGITTVCPVFVRNNVTEAKVDIPPFKLYNVEDGGPETTTIITRGDGLKYYKQMQEIRRMEQTAASLYQRKGIRGFLHLYVGQEAIAIGIKDCLRPIDGVITAYRCHGWTYLLGATVHSILAELMGKDTGVSRGKGGSMHLYTPNFYGGNGIVGAQVPIGVGIGLAYKYLKKGVCIAAYGDGAANQGQVFEAFNMAKLWKIPVLFVCENNLYAMGTSTTRSSANPVYFTRCEYIPGIWVDGMNVLAVRQATRYGLNHCAQGKGPLIFEMETYRYYGHSMADPGISYRTRDEVKKVRSERDPILVLKKILLENNLATEEELKTIDAATKKSNDAALKRATSDPYPPPEELSSKVLVEPIVPTARGTTLWKQHKL